MDGGTTTDLHDKYQLRSAAMKFNTSTRLHEGLTAPNWAIAASKVLSVGKYSLVATREQLSRASPLSGVSCMLELICFPHPRSVASIHGCFAAAPTRVLLAVFSRLQFMFPWEFTTPNHQA
jgi:hypothetical protein